MMSIYKNIRNFPALKSVFNLDYNNDIIVINWGKHQCFYSCNSIYTLDEYICNMSPYAFITYLDNIDNFDVRDTSLANIKYYSKLFYNIVYVDYKLWGADKVNKYEDVSRFAKAIFHKWQCCGRGYYLGVGEMISIDKVPLFDTQDKLLYFLMREKSLDYLRSCDNQDFFNENICFLWNLAQKPYLFECKLIEDRIYICIDDVYWGRSANAI